MYIFCLFSDDSATQHPPFLLQTGCLPRMGFEPDQRPSNVESVNEFTERMRSTLEEAKAALVKSKDDMSRYYNQRRMPAPEFRPGDKVYLDGTDITTTRPSRKLSHKYLGPFPVVRKVGNNVYRLRLPLSMSRIHLVFNVVKLTPAPDDPITGRHTAPPPPPEIVDGEEEWVVEEILDSKMMNRKLRYLVKWKDFGIEHNSCISLLTWNFPHLGPAGPSSEIWQSEKSAGCVKNGASCLAPCHKV
jgi:hypothetical protein